MAPASCGSASSGSSRSQLTGQLAGDFRALALRDLGGISVDQVGLDGYRQDRAVAGGDGAAHRGDRDRGEPLAVGVSPVPGRVQALQLDEPTDEQGQDEADAQQRDVQAADGTAAAENGPRRQVPNSEAK